jgi:hypothetical protein
MTRLNRTILLAITAAAALAFSGSPASADADSRRHVFKPADVATDDVTRDAASGPSHAPEIDGTSLGLALALAAGGLAVLAGRRRTPAA